MITNLINKKIRYIFLAIITIIVGLASRKLTFIPAVTGDILYAVMVYWLSRFLFYDRSNLFSFTTAVVFCFFIECLQLVQYPFLIYIRNNPILRLVFGQGFLWSDLIGYIVGVALAFFLDKDKNGKMCPPEKM
ncbi:DUF2809 domain-containing protein [Sphingobacterium faecium]|uniref:ribosomal maturation YjgA family protein n=1 Tax=Sphingobacterium faecium TaxID=34087 RepID=UPI0032099779